MKILHLGRDLLKTLAWPISRFQLCRATRSMLVGLEAATQRRMGRLHRPGVQSHIIETPDSAMVKRSVAVHALVSTSIASSKRRVASSIGTSNLWNSPHW